MVTNENGGRIMSHFIGLQSKMYAINQEESASNKLQGMVSAISFYDVDI